MTGKNSYKTWEYGIEHHDKKNDDSFKIFFWNKTDDIKYQADVHRYYSPFIFVFDNFKVFFFNYERSYDSLDKRGNKPIYDTLMPTKKEAKTFFEKLIEKANFLIKEKYKIDDFILIPPGEFFVKKTYFKTEDFIKNFNGSLNMLLQMETEKEASEYAEFADELFNLLEKESEFEKQYLILKTFGNVLFQNTSMVNFKENYFLRILEKEPEKTINYFKIFLYSADLNNIRQHNYTDTFLAMEDREKSFDFLFKKDAVVHLAFFAGQEEIFRNTKERIKERFGLTESVFNSLFKESFKRFLENTSLFYKNKNISPKKEIIKIMAKMDAEGIKEKIKNPLKIYDFFIKKESKNINKLKKYVLMDMLLRDYAVQYIFKKELKKMKENINEPKGIKWLEK